MICSPSLATVVLLVGFVQDKDGGKAATLAERFFAETSSEKPAAEPVTRVTDVTPLNPISQSQLPDNLKLEHLWQSGKNCGPVALYFLLQLSGLNVSPENVIKRADVDPIEGTSLGALSELASEYGLKTRVIKIDPNLLSEVPVPFIIHWEGPHSSGDDDHFDVVLSCLSNGQCSYINTTNCVLADLSTQVIKDRMSGYVLIVDQVDYREIVLWVGFVGVVLSFLFMSPLMSYVWKRSRSARSAP